MNNQLLFEHKDGNVFEIAKSQPTIKEGAMGNAIQRILKPVLDFALKKNPKIKDELSQLKGPEDIQKILSSNKASELMQKYNVGQKTPQQAPQQTTEGIFQRQLKDGNWQTRVLGVTLSGIGLTGVLVFLVILANKYGFFNGMPTDSSFAEAIWAVLKVGGAYTAASTGVASVLKKAADRDYRRAGRNPD